MGFNDIGSELADPSAIATPLRPAEMFKVKNQQFKFKYSLNFFLDFRILNWCFSRLDRFH